MEKRRAPAERKSISGEGQSDKIEFRGQIMQVMETKKLQRSSGAPEPYKMMGINLQLTDPDKRVIAVTGIGDNSGEKEIAVRLSQVFAESGERVVLIDADLRHSGENSKMKAKEADKKRGLSQFLSGKCKLEDIVYATETKNLAHIESGATSGGVSELLKRKMFEELISVLNEQFDYIVIGAPPADSVVECAAIAPCCDGMVLVIRPGRVSIKKAQWVKRQIDKTHCPILGVVMNESKAIGPS